MNVYDCVGDAVTCATCGAPVCPHDDCDNHLDGREVATGWVCSEVCWASHGLLALMEATEPRDWPSPRGYGYRTTAGARLKTWHLYVVQEFIARLRTT